MCVYTSDQDRDTSGVTNNEPLRIISFIKGVKSDDQLRQKDQINRWFDE